MRSVKITCKVCGRQEKIYPSQIFLWAEDTGHGIYHWLWEKLYYKYFKI